MDQNREERLRALRAEDAEAGADAQEVWGGSDEEVRFYYRCRCRFAELTLTFMFILAG